MNNIVIKVIMLLIIVIITKEGNSLSIVFPEIEEVLEMEDKYYKLNKENKKKRLMDEVILKKPEKIEYYVKGEYEKKEKECSLEVKFSNRAILELDKKGCIKSTEEEGSIIYKNCCLSRMIPYEVGKIRYYKEGEERYLIVESLERENGLPYYRYLLREIKDKKSKYKYELIYLYDYIYIYIERLGYKPKFDYEESIMIKE